MQQFQQRVGMNLMFIIWGISISSGKGVRTMLLVPNESLWNLNGFLISFIVAASSQFLTGLKRQRNCMKQLTCHYRAAAAR